MRTYFGGICTNLKQGIVENFCVERTALALTKGIALSYVTVTCVCVCQLRVSEKQTARQTSKHTGGRHTDKYKWRGNAIQVTLL